MSLGSGFSTDVLQAKTQLAGAQARRAQNEGALTNALNRYKAVYGRMPDDLGVLGEVPYPAAYLPTSLTQSVDVALETNPALKNAILAADIAMEDVRIAKADNFFPRIEASGERKFKKNVGGTIGSEQETLAKIEMTMDFNLGLTAINTLKASEQDLSASTFTAADTRRNIEEQVRNAWQQLETARRTASHLNNQANIAAAFLELARNERQLGRRSLIDVLSGETNLINSRSDALSAETDVIIAAYGLLAATGQLEYDIIKRSKGIKAPVFQEEPQPSARLQNDGDTDSLISEDNRSSKELMAMLRKTVKAMPVIAKTPAETDVPTSEKVSQDSVTPTQVKKVDAVEPGLIDRVWENEPEKTSNYNDANNLVDRASQIASTDVSTAYDPTEFDYVPAHGDMPVHSTPGEIADVSVVETVENVPSTSYVADMPASSQEIAALTQDLDNLSDSDMPPPQENEKLSLPNDDTPSISDALTKLFSFFASASDNSATKFETPEDVASLNWSAPTSVKNSDKVIENTAPVPDITEQATEAPDFFTSILSFFEGLTARSSTTDFEETSTLEDDEATESEPATVASISSSPDTEKLASALDLPATSEASEPDKPGFIEFLSSLFSLGTIAEKIKYSKLDEYSNEEFGR